MEKFINSIFKYIMLLFSGLYIYYAVEIYGKSRTLFILDVIVAVCFLCIFLLLFFNKND